MKSRHAAAGALVAGLALFVLSFVWPLLLPASMAWDDARAEELTAAPVRMVHVGDSFRFDVSGASRAGFGTVWLRANGAEPTETTIQPDLTLTTLEMAAPDILEVLHARLKRIDDEQALV